jgi:putative membrane protein
MNILFDILIFFIAVQHFLFLILEMFLWTKKSGRKIFGLNEEFAEKTKMMAANQGLYNGFISIGLFFGFFHNNQIFAEQIILLFLIFVIIAGIFGAFTVKKSILYIQAFPAFLAFLAYFTL